MARPIPWPTYSRTTEKPAPSATVCTAWPMSESRLPLRTCSMPAHRLSSVTVSSLRASSEISPTGMVRAASPCQPSMMAPQSMEMMSPSTSRYGPGMPWTMTSFGEVQITAGYPW